MYFDNPLVESLLRRYVGGGCINIKYRNEIMTHAMELIRQVIRTHGLNIAYGGGDESSFNDLVQIAWCQIEKTLYKFDYSETFVIGYKYKDRIGRYQLKGCIKEDDGDSIIIRVTKACNYLLKNGRKVEYNVDDLVEIPRINILQRKFINTKVFNMWSQVAKTSVLAYIKKETRDKKNFPGYSSYLRYKPIDGIPKLERFIDEAAELCKYDEDELKIIEAIKSIANSDLENASSGLISKILAQTDLSRQKILSFFKKIRAFKNEFSDSPDNDDTYYIGNSGGSTRRYNLDSEEESW